MSPTKLSYLVKFIEFEVIHLGFNFLGGMACIGPSIGCG